MTINPLATDFEHILDHTRPLWEELRGEQLFITGGTGFFGSWLLDSFLWANDRLDLKGRVTVLTRSPDSFRKRASHLAEHDSVTILPGDIRTFEFPTGTFSHVIHAATDASAKLNIENPLLMLDTIIEGTRHTLNFAKYCGGKKFLLTSSGAVYGKQPPEITHIPENYNGAPDPLDPNSAYGQGKRLAEHLCTLYASPSLEIKIARGFAFVGPYLPLDIHFAMGNIIRDAMNGGPIILKGDGTARRSYLYAADLAIWLWTILFRGETLHPYNVGSEHDYSIKDIADSVAGQFHPPIKVEVQGVHDPSRAIERYIPSTQSAQKTLSLSQTIDLNSAITRTIHWYQTQHQTNQHL